MHLKFWFSITFAFSNLVKKQDYLFGLFAKNAYLPNHNRQKKSKNYIYKLIKNTAVLISVELLELGP